MESMVSTISARFAWPHWPGWRRLPREARDTLFLLAVIAWTVLPHASHLPPWAIVLTATVLVWRGRLALVGGALPGRWTLVLVLAVAIGLTFWTYRTLLGKEPGVTLAVALMALKTLELRARRDAFVVFFLGFFLILTHFLYSQSLPVAAAMLVSVWGLLTALVLAHMPVGQPSLRQASGLAARTALFGAPVMALLFVLFPRIGPLWGVPQDGISTTGLSNSMKMGSVTEVARDDSIAMRLRFEGEPPPPPERYFRGPVLTRFDGVEWRPAGLPFAVPGVPARPPVLKTQGEPIRYEVTLEPIRLASLPLLEATTSVTPIEGFRISPRDDLQWLADRQVFERVRFKAEAYTHFTLGLPRRAGELQEAVDLPAGYNPRTIAWAQSFRNDVLNRNASATIFAQAVLEHIRNGGYSYTLAPGDYGRDGIDEFWLDRKEGFCEHFAAAFVVVMRAVGIPARVVTGYQGTDPTPVDGFYILRQSSAHAWAEYYWQSSGVGWVRADPTGAVAPDRIGRSSRLAPQPGFVASALSAMSPDLFAELRGNWKAISNRWNRWVLNYSRGQQLDVLKNIGFQSPSWEGLALLLIGTLSAFALAGAAWAWIRSASHRPLGAPARPHEARPARDRHRRGAARARREHSRRACACAWVQRASRSPLRSMRSRRSTTAALPTGGPIAS